MSFLSLRKWVGFIVVLGTLAGVAPLFAQTGGLTGAVKDDKGVPLVGYPILIERQDIKGTYKTKTNKRGEYIYIGLPIGNYKVTLQDPNGRPIYFMGTRVSLGDPTQLDIDLAKERVFQAKEQERQLAANPELARQKEQQEKEQKQFTGLKELFDRGTVLYDQQQFAEATAMFERALPLAKDKNLPVVLAKLADSYHKTRQFDKAVDAYQKAIQSKPEEATYHNNLGNVYADMGKIPDAAAEFQKAAEMDPLQASRYYFNYGAVMYNTGKMDEAVEAFKKATEIDPNFADAYFMQGRALMGKMIMTPDGKVIAAPGTAEALETYLKLDANGKYAGEAQGMLQTVRGTIETQYKAPKKKKG